MNRQLSFGFFFLISAIVLDIYVIYLIIFFFCILCLFNFGRKISTKLSYGFLFPYKSLHFVFTHIPIIFLLILLPVLRFASEYNLPPPPFYAATSVVAS